MKAALALLALAGVAHAAPVTPPPGWTHDPDESALFSGRAEAERPLGGQAREVVVDVYFAPAGSGVLYVTRAVARPSPDARDALAAAQLADHLARVSPGAAAPRVLADQKLLALAHEATGGGVRQYRRTVIAADAAVLVAVIGECILASEAPPESGPACVTALATLDPGIPLDTRIPLALAGAPAPTMTATPDVSSAPGRMELPQTTLDDGDKLRLPPLVIPETKRERDRRPVYLGLGIVVLAALFWWTRKRRERFDDSDKPVERDDDSDDLQAAARGDKDQE